MSPRSGGEADKIGNRYEGAWAIRHALYCLVRDDCSMTVEALDPDEARGAEFTFAERGKTQVHQVKRQFQNNNAWSITALARLGVFSSAIGHVAAGREYHFVSLIPCGNLRELAERARGAVDFATYNQHSLATNQELLTMTGSFGPMVTGRILLNVATPDHQEKRWDVEGQRRITPSGKQSSGC